MVVKYSEPRRARSYEGKVGDVLSDLFFRPNLLGHMGAALTYVWDRDELVLGRGENDETGEKKVQ